MDRIAGEKTSTDAVPLDHVRGHHLLRAFYKSFGHEASGSGLRMGWFGGEMSLPSKLLRNDALLIPISEAKP